MSVSPNARNSQSVTAPASGNAHINASDNAIGIFDSGVGGVSIANAIANALPNEDILYVADSAHAPYGEKSKSFVTERCQKIVEFLLSRQVKLIVVACNTATLTLIKQLRREYPITFVGVEPGIKPALAASQTGVVGVMATSNTINSQQYQELLTRFGGDKTVISQPCIGLVEQIESGDIEGPATQALLRQYVLPMLQKRVDQIVLGCTHYGFLTPQIEQLVGSQASLINTSVAIARHTATVLAQENLLNSKLGPAKIEVFSSKLDKQIIGVNTLLWRTPLSSLQRLTC